MARQQRLVYLALLFLSLLTKVGPKRSFYVPSRPKPEATFAVWITCSKTVQK